MLVKPRQSATRQELLWEMDKKTAALKKIHRLCNELLADDDCSIPAYVKKIRYIAGAHYPALEPQIGDRHTVHARAAHPTTEEEKP